MNACRITAFGAALVPKPAVFCRRLRNREGMSLPIFSPEITLLTLSGVVNPRLSISMAFRLSYLFDLKAAAARLSRLMLSPQKVQRRLGYNACRHHQSGGGRIASRFD